MQASSRERAGAGKFAAAGRCRQVRGSGILSFCRGTSLRLIGVNLSFVRLNQAYAYAGIAAFMNRLLTEKDRSCLTGKENID